MSDKPRKLALVVRDETIKWRSSGWSWGEAFLLAPDFSFRREYRVLLSVDV